MADVKTSPTRAEVRSVFARHRGAARKLAKELQRSPVTVSMWLRDDHDSRFIGDGAMKMYFELLEKESQSAA